MVRQISYNLLFNHAFCPLDIQKFRRSRYCIGRFLTQNTHHLSILAAKELFKHKDDPVTLDITRELLEDLYRETNIHTNLITVVLQRNLPDAYLKEWDEVIFAAFLEQNLKILTGRFKHLDDILDAFVTIHDNSIQYRRRIRRNTLQRVEGSVSADTALATNALNTLISTLSHSLNSSANSVPHNEVSTIVSTIVESTSTMTNVIVPNNENLVHVTDTSIANTQQVAERVAETALLSLINDPIPDINIYWHLLFHPTLPSNNVLTIESSADASLHNPDEE
jgi:hypothetical protein